MQPLVQLEVDELRELGRAAVAGVGLGARVEPHVRLQVRRRAEALLALVALVRLLPAPLLRRPLGAALEDFRVRSFFLMYNFVQ